MTDQPLAHAALPAGKLPSVQYLIDRKSVSQRRYGRFGQEKIPLLLSKIEAGVPGP
jgi:hypothetical protein